ncbi:MAG: gamma-glutamyltransferase family protein, partial [Chloroflexota bacterium]|nr:gamma-glutamyltransferase family protein [Chloroflexota bacterium]
MIGFPTTDQQTNRPAWPRRRPAPVFARNGMVAAAHPLTVAAGLEQLAGGGNAVDAAVAAALTAAVVMPEMCGIGGDLFALVHAPAGGSEGTVAVHGSGIAPRGASLAFMREHGEAGGTRMPYQGPLSVAVPGMVDACFRLLDRFGSRTFAEVATAAVGHARDGFPLGALGAAAIRENADLFRRFPASAAVFLPDGRSPGVGDVFRQPDLAATLGEIAAGGPDAFYRGGLARRMTRALADAGGVLTADDLADHATDLAPPLSVAYRGHVVQSTGLPSHGLILLEALKIAGQGDVRALGVDSAAGVHLLAESFKRAVADRLAYAVDPAFGDTPVAALFSDDWAGRRFADIDPDRAADEIPAAPLADGDTTYIAVGDGSGGMVSLIVSLSSGFGSGVVAGETGVLLNNRAGRGFTLEDGHPNVYAPGKKTMHTLHCFLVPAPDGTPQLVGGTPGGDGQPQWNLQMLAGLIDAGLDVQAAAELPRWTVWPATDPITLPNPYELRVEERLGN